MHRRFGVQSCLAGCVVLAAGMSARASIQLDGMSWDQIYTADAKPSASTPAWTSQKGDQATTVSDPPGELSIVSGASTYYYELKDNAAWAPGEDAPSYVQFRMKMTGDNPVDGFGCAITVNSNTAGHKRATLYIAKAGGKTGLFLGNTTSAPLLEFDITQWHTYRLAYSPKEASLSLWMDDEITTPPATLPPLTTFALSSNGTARQLGFGDLATSTTNSGTSVWDYVAWTNNGPPLPEPGAVGFVGLGAVALLRRRRAAR